MTLPVLSHCWRKSARGVLLPKVEAPTAKAEAASAKALVPHSETLIARLKLAIEKIRRELYGSRSERKARLLEQMELQLEELEADAGEDELAAEMVTKGSTFWSFKRKRPSRKPFPEHLQRERVVIAAPASCPCCGSPHKTDQKSSVSQLRACDGAFACRQSSAQIGQFRN
jgi:hypothetical protein